MTPSIEDHGYNKFFRNVVTYGRVAGIPSAIASLCGYHRDMSRLSHLDASERVCVAKLLEEEDLYSGYFIYECYCDMFCITLPKKSVVVKWMLNQYPDEHMFREDFEKWLTSWLNNCPDNWFYPEPNKEN